MPVEWTLGLPGHWTKCWLVQKLICSISKFLLYLLFPVLVNHLEWDVSTHLALCCNFDQDPKLQKHWTWRAMSPVMSVFAHWGINFFPRVFVAVLDRFTCDATSEQAKLRQVINSVDATIPFVYNGGCSILLSEIYSTNFARRNQKKLFDFPIFSFRILKLCEQKSSLLCSGQSMFSPWLKFWWNIWTGLRTRTGWCRVPPWWNLDHRRFVIVRTAGVVGTHYRCLESDCALF